MGPILDRKLEGLAPYIREIFHRDASKFKALEITRLPRDDLRVSAWMVVNKERYRHAVRAFKRDVIYHAKNKPDISFYVAADYVTEQLFPEYGWEQIWGFIASGGEFQSFWTRAVKRYRL